MWAPFSDCGKSKLRAIETSLLSRDQSRGRVRGKRKHDGEIASFQLSRIYAPTFTFGDIARKFVECKLALDKGSDEPMRNFYNSWLGLTWTPRRLVTTWEILGPSTASFARQRATEMIDRGLNSIIRWAEKNACPIRYMPRRLSLVCTTMMS